MTGPGAEKWPSPLHRQAFRAEEETDFQDAVSAFAPGHPEADFVDGQSQILDLVEGEAEPAGKAGRRDPANPRNSGLAGPPNAPRPRCPLGVAPLVLARMVPPCCHPGRSPARRVAAQVSGLVPFSSDKGQGYGKSPVGSGNFPSLKTARGPGCEGGYFFVSSRLVKVRGTSALARGSRLASSSSSILSPAKSQMTVRNFGSA